MPVVSAKNTKGDERTMFCRLLGQMLNEGISIDTKRRLSAEFGKIVEGCKSFQEIGAKYAVKVEESIGSDEYMHVKIFVPKEFIPNGHTGEDFIDFIVNVQNTKGGDKDKGIGPVLSKEDADKIYSKDGENTFGVQ